jgi:predicted metal-dependent phosphoesterase TrpH
MPADLHIHTFFSDGLLSPENIILKAKNANLAALAITDHDIVWR